MNGKVFPKQSRAIDPMEMQPTLLLERRKPQATEWLATAVDWLNPWAKCLWRRGNAYGARPRMGKCATILPTFNG